MQVICKALIAAGVCLGGATGLHAQADVENDKKIASCITATQLRGQFDLANEARRFSVEQKEYDGACIAACTAVNVTIRMESAAGECERRAQSQLMKDWGGRLKAGAASLLPVLTESTGGLCAVRCIRGSDSCSKECPRDLPDINRTAAGVAAAYRLQKVGNPSAADVEKAYAATVTNDAVKLSAMPAARFKEEIYDCMSATVDLAAEGARKSGSVAPGLTLLTSVAYCVEAMRQKVGGQAATPPIDPCNEMNAAAKEFRAIKNEFDYTTAHGDKNGTCVASCMAVEALTRTRPVLQSCQQSGQVQIARDTARAFLELYAKFLPAAEQTRKAQCGSVCPRGLPTVDKTAGGVAALIRFADIGDISAYDIKQVFVVAMQTFGKKLSGKSLPAIEVAAYQCAYEAVGRFAEITKDKKDPKYTALTTLGYCLDQELPGKL
jgi:hypothetical protein